jgi:hypothetical protein
LNYQKSEPMDAIISQTNRATQDLLKMSRVSKNITDAKMLQKKIQGMRQTIAKLGDIRNRSLNAIKRSKPAQLPAYLIGAKSPRARTSADPEQPEHGKIEAPVEAIAEPEPKPAEPRKPRSFKSLACANSHARAMESAKRALKECSKRYATVSF